MYMQDILHLQPVYIQDGTAGVGKKIKEQIKLMYITQCINCNPLRIDSMRNIILILREKLQNFRSDLKTCGNLDETDTFWSYIPIILITQQTIFLSILHIDGF